MNLNSRLNTFLIATLLTSNPLYASTLIENTFDNQIKLIFTLSTPNDREIFRNIINKFENEPLSIEEQNELNRIIDEINKKLLNSTSAVMIT